MLTLNSLMIGTTQAKVMGAFYEKVIGRPPEMTHEESQSYIWKLGETMLAIMHHSEMGGKAKDSGRLMLNFETAHVKEEFERLKTLGATAIREPYDMGGGTIATLADPDGNYFQLVTPM